MSFPIPTLGELRDRIRGDLGARVLGSSAGVPRRSVLGAVAVVMAGAVWLLYQFARWITDQILPDRSDAETLERHASVWGITRNPGAQSDGTLTATGTNGKTIPAGAVYVRGDGARFITATDATISGGEATVSVESELIGADGDTDTGETLTLLEPISGVDSDATVDTPGIAGGADRESDDALRARLLLRIRKPPQGGRLYDYEQWALAAHADVTRVYVEPRTPSLGEVTVYVVADDGAGGVTPSGAVLTDVEDYIEARMPTTVNQLNVVAPTPVEVDITVAIEPDTTAIRAAVEAELLRMFTTRSKVQSATRDGTLRRSWITEAISAATGEDYNDVTVPVADVTFDTGEIAVLGTITYA